MVNYIEFEAHDTNEKIEAYIGLNEWGNHKRFYVTPTDKNGYFDFIYNSADHEKKICDLFFTELEKVIDFNSWKPLYVDSAAGMKKVVWILNVKHDNNRSQVFKGFDSFPNELAILLSLMDKHIYGKLYYGDKLTESLNQLKLKNGLK